MLHRLHDIDDGVGLSDLNSKCQFRDLKGPEVRSVSTEHRTCYHWDGEVRHHEEIVARWNRV